LNDTTTPYYRQTREEMLDFVPDSARRLLDIGCGEGGFGETVKRRMPACETWGIEPVASAAAIAATKNDRVVCGSFDSELDLPPSYFDVVTMNDVLEHLPRPEPALALAKAVLKADGSLIISVPNVRYYLNVRDLLFRKDWRYTDFGILDRTHLRFFTMRSAVRTVEENGFHVLHAQGVNRDRLKLHYRLLLGMTGRFLDDMAFPQIAIVAKPV
jgi:2-polyprenyl-3-methyl-5-hydroxy-6-metoxy-1,4-benzoquinol methylase